MNFRWPLFEKFDVTTASPNVMYAVFSPVLNARKPATTAGSSTTVTAVTAGDGPFDGLQLGGQLSSLDGNTGVTDVVYVTTYTDQDNIVVDTAVDWTTGFTGAPGRHFQYRKFLKGTTADDGWFNTRTAAGLKIQVIVTTILATSITFTFEGRIKGAQQAPTTITTKTFTAAGSEYVDVQPLDAPWDEVRVGVQVAGASGAQSISAYALGT
jgi:hypothetical protein